MIQHWQWVVIAILVVLLVVVAYRTLQRVHVLWHILSQPFKKGKTYRCKVVKVSDGDTVTCRKRFFSRQQVSVRLAYIDAPELRQSHGSEAKQALQKMLLHKNVKVVVTDLDPYGRYVGDIYRLGRSISEQLIKQGYAWAYPNYAKNKAHREHLVGLQAHAKAKKVGMWKNRKNENPSDFRKRS